MEPMALLLRGRGYTAGRGVRLEQGVHPSAPAEGAQS